MGRWPELRTAGEATEGRDLGCRQRRRFDCGGNGILDGRTLLPDRLRLLFAERLARFTGRAFFLTRSSVHRPLFTVIDPLPPDFSSHQTDRTRTLIRRGLEDYLDVLSGDRVPADAEWVRGGRAAHPLVRLADGGNERALVRAYLRGGFIRHFNRNRYFSGHRAVEELRATERARDGGVNVPMVLAATERGGAWGYTATLATLWIEGMTGAIERLSRGGVERERAISLIGEQVGRMHRTGVTHPDLNLHNVLIDSATSSATLLDFDRATIHDGPAPAPDRARNLHRLARSAARLGVGFDSRDWGILRDAYGAGWPLADPRP